MARKEIFMNQFAELLRASRGICGKDFACLAEVLLMPKDRALAVFSHLKNELPWWKLLARLEVTFSGKELHPSKDILLSIWPEKRAPDTFSLPCDQNLLSSQVATLKSFFGYDFNCKHAISCSHSASQKHPFSLAILPKLSYLTKLADVYKRLGISSSVRPWDYNKDGKALYAKLSEIFLTMVGRNLIKSRYDGLDFESFVEGHFSPNHIRLAPAARMAWKSLEERFMGDAVLIATDSGSGWAGHSARFARVNAILNNRFPIDCVMGGSILILHPKRLSRDRNFLGIDCPGTVFSFDGSRRFFEVLYFTRLENKIQLGEYPADKPVQGFGPAVGWFV